MHRGEICPYGNLESDHPALQEWCNSTEQLLFLACLTLKTKTLQSFEMLRTTHPTTQYHNPADWNIFCVRFLLAENIKIPCFGCDGVQSDRCRCLRGRNHLHLHDQSWLHTITPQQTVTHGIPTILPVLFNVCFILIMVPLCLPANL